MSDDDIAFSVKTDLTVPVSPRAAASNVIPSPGRYHAQPKRSATTGTLRVTIPPGGAFDEIAAALREESAAIEPRNDEI